MNNVANSKSKLKVIYGRKSLNDGQKIFVNEEYFQIPVGEESFGIPITELNKIQKSYLGKQLLPELFIYEDFSLWWFIYPTLYPQFKKTINFVSKFLEFIDKVQPQTIVVCDFNYFDIIQQICNRKKIMLEYSKLSLLKFKTRRKLFRYIQKYRHKKITALKTKKRINLYYKKFNSVPSINSKIIFAVPTLYRRYFLNLETRESERGEYIQQKIIDLIENKASIIGIDLDYTFKGDDQILSERLEDKMPWFPLEVLLTKDHGKSHKHKEFLKNYGTITSKNEFHKLFNFNGISLWQQLENVFEQMKYASFLPFYLDLMDSLLVLFAIDKPRAIFLPYETGPLALALIIASQRFGIKTIGIAHAVVYTNNPMYSYDQFAMKKNHYGFPLPDFTLLFGKFSKDALENKGYPIEKFVVFGNAAFFNLNKIKTILANKPLHKKYNVSENKKIVLFTTCLLQGYYSSQGKYNYDTKIWRYLLENFANNDNYMVILKPHPNENTVMYEKILQEYKTTNARIIQGDLFELIYISAVVISVFSTSMLDSLCFDKPVIRVKFDNVSHTIPYDKYGVVLSTELENLSKYIHEIINDDKIKNILGKNRAQFIKEQYNIPEDEPALILKNILELNTTN